MAFSWLFANRRSFVKLREYMMVIVLICQQRRQQSKSGGERGSEQGKMSLVTEEIIAKADEVYHGDEMCQVKSKQLLKEIGLPNGLLPMQDMEECGIVRETGFVWLKQKKSYTHEFKKIGRLVTYGPEVTAHVENGKIKKLTGVQTKELLIWVTLTDIYLDDPPTGKITFQTPAGLFRTFPADAFEVEEPGKETQEVIAAVEVKEV